MSICYQGFLIQLTATRIGNWKATVSPFRGGYEMAAANPDLGELVGEFLTREAAADAAKQYIHEKQLQGLGTLLGRPDTPVMQNRGVPLAEVTGASLAGIQERRCMRRLAVVTHIPARAHGTIPVRLVDISLEGARIEHLSQLRPGFPCALELPPPAGPLSLATHVVRSSVVSNRRRVRGDRHFRYESGLAFAEVTAEQQVGLTRILESACRSE
jgi:PilZ domain-containing protein